MKEIEVHRCGINNQKATFTYEVWERDPETRTVKVLVTFLTEDAARGYLIAHGYDTTKVKINY